MTGEVRDAPVALHVPVLTPCMSSEVLRIAINVQTGAFMASVPACGQCTVFACVLCKYCSVCVCVCVCGWVGG